MKRILFALVVPIFALATTLAHAADGKALFLTCQACHGAAGEGNRQLGAPNIGGMDAWSVERQLNNFANGLRGTASGDGYGAQMHVAVSVLATPADRTAVATYIASLPRKAPPANVKGDLTNGSNYYNAVCSACHNATGFGNQAMNVPRLAGVDIVYLTRQFAAFRAGTRGYHKDDKLGKQMRAATGMLPDAKTEQDVFAYIASLKP
ncbi:MAG TPA: c-type cytochrome [Spongiibacteraceae bacterium]|nr:c-type cytochrome [Spongiibacteraceae bacterium]